MLSLFLFFTPIHGLFILVLLAIFFDTVFGLAASKIVKEPILSRKFYRLAVKLLVYLPVLIFSFVIDYFIINEFSQIFTIIPWAFTKIITIMLVSIEAFSIDEKVRKANKNRGLKYYFGRIIKVAKSVKKDYDEIKD